MESIKGKVVRFTTASHPKNASHPKTASCFSKKSKVVLHTSNKAKRNNVIYSVSCNEGF